MNKMPALTLTFWVMKICVTTLGETSGDLLSMTAAIGYAASSLILVGLFMLMLGAQLRVTRYIPLLYWMIILLTSTAGTTMSDYIDRTMGLGYAEGSALLVTALVCVLAVWRWTMGSLSVATVTNRKSELFYWGAILVSNTLGTALGDFLADSSYLGFVGGAVLISRLLTILMAAYTFTSLSRTALFWMAFVLTRPLGATVGDLLTKMPDKGGLGFGTIGSSAVLGVALVILAVIENRKERISRAS